MARGESSLTSRVGHLAMLECVILTIDAFFRTVCFGVVPRSDNARLRYKSDHIGEMPPFGLSCWTLALSVELYRLMKEHDVHSVLVLLALSCANEIDVGVADERG